MNDTRLFDFENDFVTSLRCIPMAVRFKLDRCGTKLSLRQWSRLTREDRSVLLEAPCDTPSEIAAYKATLSDLVTQRAHEEAKPLADPPQPLWEEDAVPPAVIDFAAQAGVAPPSRDAWRALTWLQRFALIKLTRDNHDNVNFVPAMREFGLVD